MDECQLFGKDGEEARIYLYHLLELTIARHS